MPIDAVSLQGVEIANNEHTGIWVLLYYHSYQ